jgi:hypothetical protein
VAKKGIRAGNAYKNGYKQYKLEGRAWKNKIKKLQRHVNMFPEDQQAKEALPRIKKSWDSLRAKPRAANSIGSARITKSISEPKLNPTKTAGEQLAKLLGIKERYIHHPNMRKSNISYKKRKNV